MEMRERRKLNVEELNRTSIESFGRCKDSSGGVLIVSQPTQHRFGFPYGRCISRGRDNPLRHLLYSA